MKLDKFVVKLKRLFNGSAISKLKRLFNGSAISGIMHTLSKEILRLDDITHESSVEEITLKLEQLKHGQSQS